MGYPYGQVSIQGQGLESFGFQEQDDTDGLALLTFGFVSGQLYTTPWCPALAEGTTLTAWANASAEGVTLTTWSNAIAEGLSMTTWIDGIAEVPPTGGSC